MFRRAYRPSYVNNFVHFASEYIEIMKEVGEINQIRFLDMRKIFRRESVKYLDICHFGPRCDISIARNLERVILDPPMHRSAHQSVVFGTSGEHP